MSNTPESLGAPGQPMLLAYAIEAEAPGWNAPRMVAATTSIMIGYAAFFAAVRERPDAEIVLRRGNQVLRRMPPGLD